MQNAIDSEHSERAFCASIILSYLLENDPSAWTDSIQLSFRLMIEGGEPSIMISTLSCAVQRCGYQAYSHFGGILVSNGCPTEVVQMFDQIAKILQDERASVEQPSTIMRLIEPPSFDKALRHEFNER